MAVGEFPGGGGLSIYVLTPQFLLSALSNSVTRVARITVSGTYVGAYTLRSGRDVGEYGPGAREVAKLDMLVEGSASAIRFHFSGELHAGTNGLPRSEPLPAAEFEMGIAVPLGELEKGIQDVEANAMAARISSVLARSSRFLSGEV